MDAIKVAQLKEALAAMQDAEEQAATAPKGQRRTLSTTVRQLGRTVTSLQEGIAESYNPNYMVCRDLGHTWQPFSSLVVDNILYRELHCTRCPSERHDNINRFGEVVGRSYRRPVDYQLPSDVNAAVGRSKHFWRGMIYMLAAREQ